MTDRLPVVFGCGGTRLSAEERLFFSQTRPLGLILFARNIDTPDQVRDLVQEFQDVVGEPTLIATDQEGGRVARFGPPHWRKAPPMKVFGDMASVHSGLAASALRLNCRLLALDLARLGINTDCLPVLDVPVEGSDNIIGDRAFSDDPALVSALGRIAVDSMMEAGILPVIKHMPGHGRAKVDSHKSLPVVEASLDELAARDFKPFSDLANAPLGMSAHVVYKAIDPDQPATWSSVVIGRIVRMKIGFGGLLMSDDLSMGALSGDIGSRARRALAAGCDIGTHCNGNMLEMKAIAKEVDPAPDGLTAKLEVLVSGLDRSCKFDYDETLEALNGRMDEWAKEMGHF